MLDERYLVGVQDVDVPTWLPDGEIAEMENVDDPNDETDQRQPTSIRTASGGIDFLNGVAEDLEEMGRALLAPAKAPEKQAPKLATIRTKTVAADKWRASNFTIGTVPLKILTEYTERRKVTIINRTTEAAIGNGHVYLSSVSTTPNAPNTFLLKYDSFIYNPVVIYTTDDIWAVCETGDAAVLDIIEEFDMEC